MPSEAKLPDSSYHKLEETQLNTLCDLLKSQVVVQSKYAYPTLRFSLLEFILALRDRFVEEKIQFESFKLNGGAASYVLDRIGQEQDDGGHDDDQPEPDYADFNDIDIIITMSLHDWDSVRSCAFAALHGFIPLDEGQKLPLTSVWDAYVGKLVHVNNENDKWALVSFTNYGSRNLELKFVQTMRRQYQFSVDSFHINLDSFLTLPSGAAPLSPDAIDRPVMAESVYGDFSEAFRHLRHRLIATKQPEEIRGGGLLRYCHLLVKGFEPENCERMRNLERYMCTRFFIDFNDPERQQHRLRSYINAHLRGSNLVTEWLRCLHAVVGSNSSLCLMNQERQRTLQLISRTALAYVQSQVQNAHSQQRLLAAHPPAPCHHSDSNGKLVERAYGGRRNLPFRRRPRFGPFFFQGGPPFILYSSEAS